MWIKVWEKPYSALHMSIVVNLFVHLNFTGKAITTTLESCCISSWYFVYVNSNNSLIRDLESGKRVKKKVKLKLQDRPWYGIYVMVYTRIMERRKQGLPFILEAVQGEGSLDYLYI